MSAQLLICWVFIWLGRCDVVAVSPPIPSQRCTELAESIRRRKGKAVMAYCV